ncbi:MAG TPA: Plug domain-containing protein [Gemmatimonadaceae bacterium]|nr:Plug domain-containing protein [Gemmatimonadaceae bacterium]
MALWPISARLGLIAGALLYAAANPAVAQVVPPPASEVPIPVKPKTDSGPDTVKTDTIKAPIGRFADPALYEIGPQYEWNRAQLFATGALSLVDLLDRIPGVTTFRSGWLSTPQTAMHNGDFRRVRIFYDGLEIDNLDGRTRGVLDLSTIQLWSLEHLSIERTASELRIYMRSWRVDNTDPYTRVDVATGNEDTNLYRGFYGKRFDNGGVLQFAGQQFGVSSSRVAGSGDALSLLARIGVAKKAWSVDGFVLRHHPTRNIQRGFSRPPVLGLDATYTDAYLRASVGNDNGGPWLTLTVGSLGFKGTTPPDRGVGAAAFGDTLERRASEAQYDLSGGLTLGPLRFEVGDRLRSILGASYNTPSARADIVSPIGVVSGFAEHDGLRGVTNADVGIRAQPLPFLALSGSVARSQAGSGVPTVGDVTALRGEAGIRLFGPWFSGGVIRADRRPGLAPVVYDTLLLPPATGELSAWTASIRGPIGAGFGVDAWLERWSPRGPYTPEYQSRSELNYSNNFIRRFPRGDFELRLSGVYEYRSHVDFPLAAGDVRTEAERTVSAMLEIRIMRAVITYQQRNITAYQYPIVPGFEMPRVLAIYGVRWDFWN